MVSFSVRNWLQDVDGEFYASTDEHFRLANSQVSAELACEKVSTVFIYEMARLLPYICAITCAGKEKALLLSALLTNIESYLNRRALTM